MAIEIGNQLLDIADMVEAQKKFRFAEQLRGAAMSISNNIAEGSGSYSIAEFKQFLNYAHRSCFECANILVILQKRNIIEAAIKIKLFEELDILSRKITNFKNSLK